MSVIGVAGQLRNGKDMTSDYLAEKLEFKRAAFASNVKKIFCDTFGVDLDFVEKWKTSAESPPGFNMNVRQALQFIGDGFRKIKSDIWIDLVFRNNPEKIVISDVRYVNELKKIKEKNGVNILIYRPGYLNQETNDSEAQIRPFVEYFLNEGKEGRVDAEDKFSLVDFFIINDGTLEDLYNKIDNLIIESK